MESDATSHPRSSLLTSFLGRSTRPRSTVNNNLSPGYPSPTTETAPAVSGTVPMNIGNIAVGNRRRGASGAGGAQGLGPSSLPSGSQMPNPASITANTITQMLRRRRSANGPSLVVSNPPNPGHGPPANHMNAANAPATPAVAPVLGSAHRIRLVPHLESQRSLHFDPITRECREGAQPIRIGRFTDRTGSLAASTNSLTGKIAFKSKVVSRGHAELWCEPNAKFFIRDTSSSSGTFLNHMRLSHAGMESRPFLLKDGDILQLGVDYQGGTEEIYRCVKIRVEIGREWQAGPNAFNTAALAQLRLLSNLPNAGPTSTGLTQSTTTGSKQKTGVGDCCICLFPVTICQALFIGPCSHSFHYKCIRTTLLEHHPGFSCPICRSFHDLEADVEVEIPGVDEEWEEIPQESADILNNVSGPSTSAAGNMVLDPPPVYVIEKPHHHQWAVSPDDDDMPSRTAAEENDRRVLQPVHQTLSSPPPVPPRRTLPRSGSVIPTNPHVGANLADETWHPSATPTSAPGRLADDIDRGLEMDGGGGPPGGGPGGAETDMEVDETSFAAPTSGPAAPRRGRASSPLSSQNSNQNQALGPAQGRQRGQRSHGGPGPAVGRSTLYNLVDGSGGSGAFPPSAHGTGLGVGAGMNSAPNLVLAGGGTGTGTATGTPPRALPQLPFGQQQQQQAGNSTTRGANAHNGQAQPFGDVAPAGGASGSAGGEGVEDGLNMSGEEMTVEGGMGVLGFLSGGSKRKR